MTTLEGSAPIPADLYLARLSPGSRPSIRSALRSLARILSEGQSDARALSWQSLRYAHTQTLRARLAESYAPATANHYLSALRGVLQECWTLGLLSAEDYHRAVGIKPVPGTSPPSGRALSASELGSLLAVCNESSVAGVRDAALFSILYGAGLRRSEAVALELQDHDPAEQTLGVRKGKGGKFRKVYLTGRARECLSRWRALRGDTPGALLCAVDARGRIRPGQMTAQAVYYRVRRRAAQAGLELLSPHDFRRTFVSHLLEAGVDIATVQQMAGHQNIQTTARYDRRGESAKRKAADLLWLPLDSAAPGGAAPGR